MLQPRGMVLTIQCLDIDAADPDRLASFWADALGWRRTHDLVEEVVLEPPEHSVWDGVVADLLFSVCRTRRPARIGCTSTCAQMIKLLRWHGSSCWALPRSTSANLPTSAGSSWPIPKGTNSACWHRCRRNSRLSSTQSSLPVTWPYISVVVCARDCSCPRSTRWLSRRSSLSCLPRRRRAAGTACSSGITCTGVSRSLPSLIPGSRSRRWPQRLRGSASARWSRHWPDVGRSRSLARLRRSTGSAAAGSRSASAWAAMNSGSEYSITGEELDAKRRAGMLDEGLAILTAAWSGEPVQHQGEHYTVDGMRFLPRPVQLPGVPVWVAGFYGKPKPLRRAARYQGFFPVNLEHPDQLAEIVAELTALRRQAGRDPAESFDVVAALPPHADSAPYRAAGATWWVVDFPGDAVSVDLVRAVIRGRPGAPLVGVCRRSVGGRWATSFSPASGPRRRRRGPWQPARWLGPRRRSAWCSGWM